MTVRTEPAEDLRIAYSPCPNDTFVFDAWAHGRGGGAPRLYLSIDDIDIKKGWAVSGGDDHQVQKV